MVDSGHCHLSKPQERHFRSLLLPDEHFTVRVSLVRQWARGQALARLWGIRAVLLVLTVLAWRDQGPRSPAAALSALGLAVGWFGVRAFAGRRLHLDVARDRLTLTDARGVCLKRITWPMLTDVRTLAATARGGAAEAFVVGWRSSSCWHALFMESSDPSARRLVRLVDLVVGPEREIYLSLLSKQEDSTD